MLFYQVFEMPCVLYIYSNLNSEQSHFQMLNNRMWLVAILWESV